MRCKRLIALFLSMVLLVTVSISASAASGTKYEAESNNSMSSADRTYDDYDNYGRISPAGDEDWWVVKFNKSGCGSFWLGNIPSGHDYDLRVYDRYGNVISKSINNGNTQEFVTVDITANVDYYVKVYGNGTSSSSYYLMRAKLYTWRDCTGMALYEQQTGSTCGAANMRMILYKYGISQTESDVIQRAREVTNMSDGYMYQTLHYAVLNDYLAAYGKPTRYKYTLVNWISEASYLSNIQRNINGNYPLIALCEYSDSPYFGTSDGHFITIRGYSPDAQRAQVRVNDSTPGTYGIKGIPLSLLRDYTNSSNGRCHFTSVLWS